MALHTAPARKNILDRHEHGVAEVQLPGDVGGRDGDHKWGGGGVVAGGEEAAPLPPCVEALLDLLMLVGLGHLGRALGRGLGITAHGILDNKRTKLSGS